MVLVKKHGKWCLYSRKEPRRNLGCYRTKEGAEKRERQVAYFKHRGRRPEDVVEIHVPCVACKRGHTVRWVAEQFWLDSGWTVEERPIELLILHEQPDPELVETIARALLDGESIPMVLIGKDGFVLDGHHRIEAAAKVIGEDATIPVLVKPVRRLSHEEMLVSYRKEGV